MSAITEFNVFIWYVIALGVSATVLMDVYSLALKYLFKTPPLDYALVGRWVLHFGEQRLMHRTIMHSAPKRGELVVGWGLHYAIGVIFATTFIYLCQILGLDAHHLLWNLLFGVVTLIFPFTVMQPCLGFGFAASKTPSPCLAIFKSAAAHSVFGLGLYLSINALENIDFGI
ncbi:hypothetical protein N474_09635 [Pseudoalteromonas luteoviolacea CPMOR-2]|uniref:DUF2938 family protein n=1 Tax=Pseudoalteromonas luteoviolacea TaxID=43657 RepID=UPI0007B06E02|nr:DUF2938 family protein [Pseudoalteromonas luteoviolacea]KZN56872.1 hypothetical protein N474_09635 [Pseudoalteromonas luteoviolacea CPMOR-2]